MIDVARAVRSPATSLGIVAAFCLASGYLQLLHGTLLVESHLVPRISTSLIALVVAVGAGAHVMIWLVGCTILLATIRIIGSADTQVTWSALALLTARAQWPLVLWALAASTGLHQILDEVRALGGIDPPSTFQSRPWQLDALGFGRDIAYLTALGFLVYELKSELRLSSYVKTVAYVLPLTLFAVCWLVFNAVIMKVLQ